MARLIEIAIVVAAAVYVWRGFRRQQQSVTEALKRAERATDDRAPETLVKDPATGIYRPVDWRQ